MDVIARAYTEIHRLGVRHDDTELRNLMYDGSFMVMDFERAKFHSRPPLDPTSLNDQSRKREWGITQKQGKDPFTEELRMVVESISACFRKKAVSDSRGVSAGGSSAQRHGETACILRREVKAEYSCAG